MKDHRNTSPANKQVSQCLEVAEVYELMQNELLENLASYATETGFDLSILNLNR